MDDRLRGLTQIPGKEAQGIYLQELREQCAMLEAQLLQVAESGSVHLQALVEESHQTLKEQGEGSGT